MRKDYLRGSSSAETGETQFVEDYWTKVWEGEGGPKTVIDKVARKDEYKAMAPYLAMLPKGSRLLDGGCGLGEWTVYLNRQGFPTTGIDLSRKTVAQLCKLFPEADFAAGDIRATGLPDASFDAYFSWGVFEHFENGPQDCIREAMRLLKPGGYLFISVPMDNLRHALRATVGRRLKQQPSPGSGRFYQWRFTRTELADELAMGGFEVLEVKPIHKRQGVMRSLHHELGLPYSWLLTKGLGVALAPLIPGWLLSHMVLAVVRKPLA